MGLTQMLTMSDGKILILEDMETTQRVLPSILRSASLIPQVQESI